MTGQESISPFPEYLERAAPGLAELMDMTAIEAAERGVVTNTYTAYRDLTPNEIENLKLVDPVLQKTFVIPYVSCRATGIGVKLKIETEAETSKYTINYGLRMQSETSSRAQHEQLINYELHEDGVTYSQHRRATEDHSLPSGFDEQTGLPIYSWGSFWLSQMAAERMGVQALSEEEQQRLCKLVSSLELGTIDPDRLRTLVEEVTLTAGNITYEVEREPSEIFYEEDESSEPECLTVKAETTPSGERTITYGSDGDIKFKITLNANNQLTLAETYTENRIPGEADQLERQTGFSLPNPEELAYYLNEIAQVLIL